MRLKFEREIPLATDSLFTDEDVDELWWQLGYKRHTLMRDFHPVGAVAMKFITWQATPHWGEPSQEFDTEEEAKAWLQVMYRMRPDKSY